MIVTIQPQRVPKQHEELEDFLLDFRPVCPNNFLISACLLFCGNLHCSSAVLLLSYLYVCILLLG